jgi:hypothetical protein
MTANKLEDSGFVGYDSIYCILPYRYRRTNLHGVMIGVFSITALRTSNNDYKRVLVVLFSLLKYEHALLGRCSG